MPVVWDNFSLKERSSKVETTSFSNLSIKVGILFVKFISLEKSFPVPAGKYAIGIDWLNLMSDAMDSFNVPSPPIIMIRLLACKVGNNFLIIW